MAADPDSVALPLDEPAPGRETAETMRRRICHSYPSDRYAVLFEVRNATGVSVKRRDGYCDAMVMGLWPSRGLELWGMEIKVSRSDWLRELKRPEKCEEFFRYCHRWFVVAPDGVVKLEELPPTWGLMVPSRDGLRTVVAGKQLEPQPADVGLLASICRSAADGWMRHPSYLSAIASHTARIEERVLEGTKSERARVERLADKVADFELASGVPLFERYTLRELIHAKETSPELRAKLQRVHADVSDGRWWESPEKIGAAVRTVLEGGIDRMRQRLLDMSTTAREIAEQAEQSLREFDARGGK